MTGQMTVEFRIEAGLMLTGANRQNEGHYYGDTEPNALVVHYKLVLSSKTYVIVVVVFLRTQRHFFRF